MKTTGAVLAGLVGIVGTGSGQQNSEYDPSTVTWSDEESVVRYSNRVNELNESQQREIIDELSVEQEEAIVAAQDDQLSYVRTRTVSREQSDMATENREPTAAAAPGVPTNYKESVVGYDGIGPFKDKKFEFRHTIEWNYDGDDYYANVSSINGETYDWVWSYEGPGAKSDAEYGSFFDHRREGVFEAGITNPTTVTPHIELRGTADGDGRTVSQDDDWPDENLP